MTTTPSKTRCAICAKGNAALKCKGCSKIFCSNHFIVHREQLSQQLEEIEVDRDLLREELTQQTTDPKQHLLIQQINQWEEKSIQKICERAKQARQSILKYMGDPNNHIEEKLNELTNQIKQCRKDNDITETDLERWKQELKKMIEELRDKVEELNKSSTVTIQQSSTQLINNIRVGISRK